MKESSRHDHSSQSRNKTNPEPSFQIICLASGGGPSEDSVTGFLVRSVATQWSRNSILAVDAGSHLASLTRLLQPHFPLVAETRARNRSAHEWIDSAPVNDDTQAESSDSESKSPEPKKVTTLDHGPFAGLSFPYQSARANALWVVRECVSTYLITHPHLDHLSALAINTAAFHNTSRPKRLAALPSTVNAIKTHIFNDIIWPNLSDEDGGVGFVTFQRLASGGNIAVGEGSGKGYIEVCDSLCVKGLKISHGHCTRGPDAVPKRGSDVGLSDPTIIKNTAVEGSDQRKMSASLISPSVNESANDTGCQEVVVDSTAYFIRDDATGREILFFGDVEPDCLSLNPRTLQVWTDAAPKISSGQLKAVLIECSYDDSQTDNILFGHLNPRHLIKELQTLAELVRVRKIEDSQKRSGRKRKLNRMATDDVNMSTAPTTDDEGPSRAKRKSQNHTWPPTLAVAGNGYHKSDGLSPRSQPVGNGDAVHDSFPTGPLAGLTVIVIHVKDNLQDGPFVGDRILRQLQEHDSRLKELDGAGLGCEFVISEKGGSYWF